MINRTEIIDYLYEHKRLPEAKLRDLKVSLSLNFISTIIGPRRAGKTYYLYYLFNKLEEALYLNFEDSRLYGINYKEIRNILRIYIEEFGKQPKVLLLDEIQEIDKWEIILRELHDLKRYIIVITGSSSKLLSKELATQLRGRTLTYLLLPLNFKEYLYFKGINFNNFKTKDEISFLKKELKEFLEFGSFPDVILNNEKIKILKEYSELILFRDFIERHKIRNFQLARFLLNFMFQNFAKEITIRSIYNKLKVSGVNISKNTVYEYIDKLEDTLIVFFLRRYSYKVHLRESWPKKVYVADTGITKLFRFSEDIGKLMENAVFLELLRRTNENPLTQIYYYKSKEGYEVDFVIKKGLKVKQLIQVTDASSKEEIKKRELRALLKASKELQCKDLLVITWDYETEEDGIKFMPLWKWLLE